MKRKLALFFSIICLISLIGCGQKKSELSAETKDAVDNLYSIQNNYAQGVAPLIEIPPAWAEELYNNYEVIIDSGVEGAPISLREYAAIDTVYFDYDTDFSVVWDKTNGNVTVEPTDVSEREAFKEKMHK